MKSLNWKFISECLKARREHRKMTKAGYRMHETDWEIVRGGRSRESDVILDVQISADRKHVWTRIGTVE